MKKSMIAGIGLGVMTSLHIYFDRLVKNGYKNKANGEFDYVIVLGAKVNAGAEPSEALKNRLNKAVAYANKYPHVCFVVTGGQGADEDATEASVMFQYMIQHGVAPERIIIEDASTSTYENIRNSLYLLPHVEGVTIITSDYHCERAKIIAKRFGLQANAVPADTPENIKFKVVQRERVLILKAAITGR